MFKLATSLALVTLTSACSSMLPVSHSDSSSFQSFEEARNAVVALVPMKSSKKAAEKDGVDFAKQPNTKILTHSDVVRLLVPAGMLKREDLDPGILVCLAMFTIFYLMTVFTLSWGTTALHYDRSRFLLIQLFGIIFFGLCIPISSVLAERGRRPVMFGVTAGIALFGFVLAPLFGAGTTGVVVMMVLGMSLMGMTYGPLGTIVSELFPTAVRYTGSSIAFSMAGILGASLAPYAATWLATHYGLKYVGYYLSASAVLTFIGLLLIEETKDADLTLTLNR